MTVVYFNLFLLHHINPIKPKQINVYILGSFNINIKLHIKAISVSLRTTTACYNRRCAIVWTWMFEWDVNSLRIILVYSYSSHNTGNNDSTWNIWRTMWLVWMKPYGLDYCQCYTGPSSKYCKLQVTFVQCSVSQSRPWPWTFEWKVDLWAPLVTRSVTFLLARCPYCLFLSLSPSPSLSLGFSPPLCLISPSPVYSSVSSSWIQNMATRSCDNLHMWWYSWCNILNECSSVWICVCGKSQSADACS